MPLDPIRRDGRIRNSHAFHAPCPARTRVYRVSRPVFRGVRGGNDRQAVRPAGPAARARRAWSVCSGAPASPSSGATAPCSRPLCSAGGGCFSVAGKSGLVAIRAGTAVAFRVTEGNDGYRSLGRESIYVVRARDRHPCALCHGLMARSSDAGRGLLRDSVAAVRGFVDVHSHAVPSGMAVLARSRRGSSCAGSRFQSLVGRRTLVWASVGEGPPSLSVVVEWPQLAAGVWVRLPSGAIPALSQRAFSAISCSGFAPR
jgi:hypothetical protein